MTEAQAERHIIVKKCFDCPRCIYNPEPPKPFQIWRCYTGKGQEFPLNAPNCDNSIPDNCPLPVYSSANPGAVLEVGIDYILQKLELEYDDNGYNPNIPLWIQVRDDLRTIRQQKEREQG